MRKIDTSFITTGVGMPIKSGTLDHLQLSYQEALTALAQSIIGNYTSGVVYILTGCTNSGLGTSYNISQGYVYYNGEVFYVPNAIFTSLNTAVFTPVNTTYLTGVNADPVEFTDSNTHNVHQIRTIEVIAGVSGSGISDYADAVAFNWKYETLTGCTFFSGTGTFNSGYVFYKRSGNALILNYSVSVALATLGTLNSIGITIDLPIPKSADISLSDTYTAAASFNISGASTFYNVGNAFINDSLFTNNKLALYTPQAIVGSINVFGQIIYPI